LSLKPGENFTEKVHSPLMARGLSLPFNNVVRVLTFSQSVPDDRKPKEIDSLIQKALSKSL
jgi:hypothetical protein